MLLELIPIFGDAITIAETYQGEDIWGRKMAWIDYGLAAITVFSSVGDVAGVVKVTQKFPEQIARLHSSLRKAHSMAKAMSTDELLMLAKTYKTDCDALNRFMQSPMSKMRVLDLQFC